MQAKELVQAIIGSKRYVVEDIAVSTEMNEIKVCIRPMKQEKCRCGICHRRAPLYDKGRGRGRRRWRCLDVGAPKVYVETKLLRVCCRKHGVVTAAVPRARHGSPGLPKALKIRRHGSARTHPATRCRSSCGWNSIRWAAYAPAYIKSWKWPARLVSTLRSIIGIDETSYKKTTSI